MRKEIDRRDFSKSRMTESRKKDLTEYAQRISDEKTGGQYKLRIEKFDDTTGNPAIITSESSSEEKNNYIQRALEHVRSISPVLGLTSSQSKEFVPDPIVSQTSSGAKIVHLNQRYHGIQIFQSQTTVKFGPDDKLQKVGGNTITIPVNLSVAPKLSVQEAVLKAAQYLVEPDTNSEVTMDQYGQPMSSLSMDLNGFIPTVIASIKSEPKMDTILESGPFGDKSKANLTWFDMGNDGIRLGWEVIITMPHHNGKYRTIVDAENGGILYCRQLINYQRAKGDVYITNGDENRQMINFPRALEDYNWPVLPLPNGFPDTWVDNDMTKGNCVDANSALGHWEKIGNKQQFKDDGLGPVTKGIVQDGMCIFESSDKNGMDQEVVNLFYLCCYAHDFFYILGFREADGNFQRNNFGRGGIPGDPVSARAFNMIVQGTAHMEPHVDGSSPIMRAGWVEFPPNQNLPPRHTAFDASAIFHEYTHGVTTCLVGGRIDTSSLESRQSKGMGEGWSDYIACILTKSNVVASWVVNNPNGIRNFPYDSNYPCDFSHLGMIVNINGSQVDFRDGETYDEHNIGEIWCATLLDMNRAIGEKLGVQLVVDALKLSPTNPGFLDERDAILEALDDMLSDGKLNVADAKKIKEAIWRVFAKYGMGPKAQSFGAQLSGIVADFNPPTS
jgi:extracellular elastinolytic metalloproteinase